MRLILLGAPGSGKGTQAEVLSDKLRIPHISTGDIFRSNIKSGTELGRKAKEYIDKGMLVPDEVTIGIVKDRLQQPDCAKGFILDGFPRTIPQAEYLDQVLKSLDVTLDVVLNIHVADETIIERMSGRRFCPGCNATYHVVYKPSSKGEICGHCNTPLIIREDDKPETVISRLGTYHKQTEPLIDYYEKQKKLVTVYGQEDVSHTTAHVFEALGVK